MKFGILLHFLSFLPFVYSSTTIKVSGQIICCNNKILHQRVGLLTAIPPVCRALTGNKIELWEHDYITADDYKSTTETDKDGNFELKGSESWDPSVHFYMKSFHTSGLSKEQILRKCFRISIRFIPKQYNDGEYDLTWDVTGEFPMDEALCPSRIPLE